MDVLTPSSDLLNNPKRGTDCRPFLIVVLGSLVGQYFGYSLDKPAAVIVAVFIAHAGWEILFGGVKVLLDASLDKKTLDRIRSILMEQPAIKKIKALTGRNSGSYKFIEVELVMNVRDLERAHAVSTEIEQKIKEQIQNVDHVLIHYEPIIKDTLMFAVMLDAREGQISHEYGGAPYIALFTKQINTGELSEQKIFENSFTAQKTGKGIALSEFFVEQGVDVVFTKTPFQGKGPGYVLSDANIRIQIAHEAQLEDLVRYCLRNF